MDDGSLTGETNADRLALGLKVAKGLQDGWAGDEPSVAPTSAALEKAELLGPMLINCGERCLTLGVCRDGALLFTLAAQDDAQTIEIWIEPDGSVEIA